MMAQENSIEVFQDLVLRGPEADRKELREALIKLASAPWSHAKDKEKKFASRVSTDNEFLAFQRDADDHLPAAGLTLWSRPDGYEITNIVPRELGELGIAKYNALLQEFAHLIADPAAKSTGYSLETTASHQTLEDWTSPEAAQALRHFSAAANKSTGSSHPLDSKRWMRFLIVAHRSGRRLGSDRLSRWLIEVERWDGDSANELVIKYESALDLLREYDTERP